jgi:hypothetical protein
VVLDMGQIQLLDEGQNRVRLTGAQGRAPTDQLKVVAGFRDGFKAEITWGFSWSAANCTSETCPLTSCLSNTPA